MHDVPPEGPAPLARRREWIGLAVLSLPTLLVALDIGVLFLALPHLSTDLGATSTEQLWITDIYGFLLAGFLITMGNLGDRIGRRRLLMIGAAAFGAASALAAFSWTPEILIFSRALLGIAGATLGPSTLALISNMFRDGRQRGRAISLWATCQFGGAALGPVIGGLLLEHFWWGAVFLLGVPVMLLLMVVAPRLLPEYRAPNTGRLDLVSVAMSLAAILPMIYGVKELATWDGGRPTLTVAAIVAGLVVGTLFVHRQLRLSNPLLDLRLFRNRAFSAALGAMLLSAGVLAGASLMTSQYVQTVVGLGPGTAGLWQAPCGLGIAAGVLLAPTMLRWMTPATAIIAGSAVSVLGLAALAVVGSTGGLVIVSAAIAVTSFGGGPIFVIATGLVVGSAPPERAGSAASMSETSAVLGSTLGLALLGSVGAAVYRRQMDDAAPADVPADVAATARETIAAAAEAASRLAPGPAGELLSSARDAFTAGMHVVSAIGAMITIAVAVLIAAAMRPKRPEGAPDTGTATGVTTAATRKAVG